MSTLLCIHGYPGALPTIRLFWPHYKVPGWPILGIDCEDGSFEWPEGTPHIGIGKNKYVDGDDNLCHKLIGTIRHAIEFYNPDEICVIEHDAIFLGKPPHHPGGLFTCHAVGPQPYFGYKANQGFHCPWWMDRKTAVKVVETGEKLIEMGEIEHGTPDMFLGLIADRASIPWTHSGTFSVNSGCFKHRRKEAGEAIKSGVWFLHGIKTKEELDWVLSKRP